MLHIESLVITARNASYARIMVKAALTALRGEYASGVTREFMEALAKDAGTTSGPAEVQAAQDSAGRETAFVLRHSLKGAELKGLKADISAIRKSDTVAALPKTVSAKSYALDKTKIAPAIMDMSVGDLARLMERHGVRAVIHNGVISMGAGKSAVKVDVTDGQILPDAGTAEWRANQGKLTALAYVLSMGGKLSKTQRAFMDDREADNVTTPGMYAIPNEHGVMPALSN